MMSGPAPESLIVVLVARVRFRGGLFNRDPDKSTPFTVISLEMELSPTTRVAAVICPNSVLSICRCKGLTATLPTSIATPLELAGKMVTVPAPLLMVPGISTSSAVIVVLCDPPAVMDWLTFRTPVAAFTATSPLAVEIPVSGPPPNTATDPTSTPSSSWYLNDWFPLLPVMFAASVVTLLPAWLKSEALTAVTAKPFASTTPPELSVTAPTVAVNPTLPAPALIVPARLMADPLTLMS